MEQEVEILYERLDGVAVVRLTDPAEVEGLVALFERIAAEESWQPQGQLRAFVGRSVYFGLRIRDVLVGGLQLVLPDDTTGLPCHEVWPEIDLGLSTNIAHVAVLALSGECRGAGGLFWLLCAELWRYCMAQKVADIWLEVTPRNFRIYTRLGWPLCIEGPLRRHWGEECYLCTMNVSEVTQVFTRMAGLSDTYRQIAEHACRDEVPGYRLPSRLNPTPVG